MHVLVDVGLLCFESLPQSDLVSLCALFHQVLLNGVLDNVVVIHIHLPHFTGSFGNKDKAIYNIEIKEQIKQIIIYGLIIVLTLKLLALIRL